MQIGEKIKNYRKTAGLTQEQVADYLDVSTPAVNKWEIGNTYPDISLLPAIARLLKIDMNELFSFREELTEKERRKKIVSQSSNPENLHGGFCYKHYLGEDGHIYVKTDIGVVLRWF